jgi:hypothetical protein
MRRIVRMGEPASSESVIAGASAEAERQQLHCSRLAARVFDIR